MRRFWGALVAMALVVGGWAARADERPEVMALRNADSWLATIDQGKYVESWDAASKLFQSGITRDKWKDALIGVRKPLGKLVARTFKSAEHKTSAPGAPDGHYIIIKYQTVFENKKSALETVTPMLEADGSWKISGYYIN